MDEQDKTLILPEGSDESASLTHALSHARDQVQSQTVTTVDSGEDLLDKTAILPTAEATVILSPEVAQVVSKREPTLNYSTPEEGLENAQIFFSEGFCDEAKKILHRLIAQDPNYSDARKLLERVHERELEQLLGSSLAPPRPRQQWRPELFESPENVLERLDHDLDLGVSVSSLVLNAPISKDFTQQLESQLVHVASQDALDIGIGFLEMGLFELANAQFRKALFENELRLISSALLATSLLQSQQAFDALLVLEAVIPDQEIPEEQKTELFYLMGRAQEQLEKWPLALQWYGRVLRADKNYRDSNERVAAIQRQLKGK